MKREKNLQEDEKDVDDDLDGQRGKKVKTERCGDDDQPNRQEPDADLSDNTRFVDHHDLKAMDNAEDKDNPKPRDEVDHVSYVRLPEDHPISIPSGRSWLDSSVLNDHWVLSVILPREDSNLHEEEDRDEDLETDDDDDIWKTTEEIDQVSDQEHGNENAASDDADNKTDNSINLQNLVDEDNDDAVPKERSMLSKRKRKSKYQERMLKIEDKQCDIDVLIETALSAHERCTEVYNSIKEDTLILDGPLLIEQHFSATQLWRIKLLYREYGLDVLENIRNDPTKTLPVIIKRLKQNYDQCCKYRSDKREAWAKKYAENHFKSLNPPSP